MSATPGPVIGAPVEVATREAPAPARRLSGRYEAVPAVPAQAGGAAAPVETLVLDVEEPYPLTKASGSMPAAAGPVEWFADLTVRSANKWSGKIVHHHPADAAFPWTDLDIDATGPNLRVVFTGPDAARTREFVGAGRSPGQARAGPFREVLLEVDRTDDTDAVTSFTPAPGDPPQPPFPGGTLTIENVFQRAGCLLHRVAGEANPPIALAGTNGQWNDAELHDAMQKHWQHWQDRGNTPAWALWLLFAYQHEDTGRGGMMFDIRGDGQRQGAAVFKESPFYHGATGDDLIRYRFWCAVHEMSHCFNLPHAREAKINSPDWMKRHDEPDFPTFTNYPWLADAATGRADYFSQFQYRFSDEELRFLRHAPEELVKMGAAPFGRGAPGPGVAQVAAAAVETPSGYELAARLHRPPGSSGGPELEFMEPLVLELRLKNVSGRTVRAPREALDPSDVRITIRHENGPQRRCVPYARACSGERREDLPHGRSFYEQVFAGVGLRGPADRGWLVDRPGLYTVEAATRVDGRTIRAEPLRVRVRAPETPAHERLAQDFFSDRVARFLAFDGSNLPGNASDVLRRLLDELPGSRAAVHARIALASIRRRRTKLLDPERRAIVPQREDPSAAEELFRDALTADTPATLGHLDYEYYARQRATMLSVFETPGRALAAWDDAVTNMKGAIKPRPVPPGVEKTWADFRATLEKPYSGKRREPNPEPPTPRSSKGAFLLGAAVGGVALFAGQRAINAVWPTSPRPSRGTVRRARRHCRPGAGRTRSRSGTTRSAAPCRPISRGGLGDRRSEPARASSIPRSTSRSPTSKRSAP